MVVLGTARPATACLTCHCDSWCDAKLNCPICSRLSWHKSELIGGKREEKGALNLWLGKAWHPTKNLLNHSPEMVQSINKGVMERESGLVFSRGQTG